MPGHDLNCIPHCNQFRLSNARMAFMPRTPTLRRQTKACPQSAGDGVADDTEALERAVAVLSARRVPGILSIPPGTFRISRMINISAPLVLQGAGQDATTLFFPLPLSVVRLLHVNALLDRNV